MLYYQNKKIYEVNEFHRFSSDYSIPMIVCFELNCQLDCVHKLIFFGYVSLKHVDEMLGIDTSDTGYFNVFCLL